MKSSLASTMNVLAQLARVLVTSMVVSVVALVAAAAVAAAGVWLGPERTSALARLVWVVATLEAAALGGLLGAKRGLLLGAAHLIRTQRMAGRLLGRLFDKTLGVHEDGTFGDRGGTLARGLECLPLAQAEILLTRAVDALVAEGGEAAGWVARSGQWIRRWALRAIGDKTLARFREADATKGGIDLVLLRKQMEPRIDGDIATSMEDSARKWLVLATVTFPLAVAAQLALLVYLRLL